MLTNYKTDYRVRYIERFHFKKLWNRMLPSTTRSSWSAICTSCVYLSLSYYRNYKDVSLENFAKYCLQQSQKKHTKKLIWSCGTNRWPDLPSEYRETRPWMLEKVWISHYWKWTNWPVNDPYFYDFLENYYLTNKQVKFIKELNDCVTNSYRMRALESDMTEYLWQVHLGKSNNES